MNASSGFKRLLAVGAAGVIAATTALPMGVNTSIALATDDSELVPFDVVVSQPGSEPKVFAHYFPPYPISIDNKPPDSDYYTTQYLNPHGEGDKHLDYGGFLRDRPIGQNPLDGDWKKANYIQEINQAADAGIDGFFVDILSLGLNWEYTLGVMNAAAESGRDFVVSPQVDGTAQPSQATPAQVAARMAELAVMPAAYHLPTGEFVLSAFKAESMPVDWWSEIISILENEYGIATVFMPVFLDANYMTAFAPISDAVGNWGVRNPGNTLAGPNYAAQAHALGLKWISPVSVQDERPNQSAYWEAANLAQLRASWTRTIEDGSDLVMLTTWNDYSEGTGFAPSEGHGYSFLDVSAYYSNYFKTGAFAPIERDALYLTHRKQPYAALPTLNHSLMELFNGSYNPSQDTVEVMTFLTAPATLTITTGATSQTFSAEAGVNEFVVPLALGSISATLSRDGVPIAATTTGITVTDQPEVQDLQYYAASSLRNPAPLPTDTEAPSAPTDLTASVAGTDVALSWGAATDDVGVSGYRIERAASGSTEWTRVGDTTSATTFTDTGVPAGEWSYRVIASDGAGNLGPASATATATVEVGEAPGAPTDLAANVSGYRVHLTWSAVDTSAKYIVERSETGTGDWARLGDPITATSFSDLGLPIGVWHYRVTATDGSGSTGPASSSVAAEIRDISPPSAPSGLVASATSGNVALSWNASNDNVGVARYSVERSPTGTGQWTQLIGTTDTTFIDSGRPGELWFYRVIAIDAEGNRSFASTTASATVADTTAPAEPTGLAASAAGANVVLTWNATTDNTSAISYIVERSAAGTDDWTGLTTTAETLYTDLGRPVGEWSYRVTATDAAGNLSPSSAPVGVTVRDTTPPSAPIGLTSAVTDQAVTLTWGAATDDTAVSAYRVERSATGTGGWIQVARTDATTFTDPGRPTGTWFYRVSASDAAGNNGAASDIAEVEVADTVSPTAPTGLTTDVIGYRVVVAWSAASDNSGVTGYRVERSATGTGDWVDQGVTVGTLYMDTGRPVGEWFYRVSAIDAAGNTSAPSSVGSANVIDLTAPAAPTGLDATVTGRDVALEWDASTDNVGVTGYRVERSPTGTGSWIQLARTTGTTYTDINRGLGAWYYRVIAVDAANNSSPVSGTAATTVVDTPGEPVSVMLTPTADAYVRNDLPNENFGSLNQVFSSGPAPELLSYLAFDLPEAPAGTTLTSATLRLRTTTAAGSGSADAHLVSLGEGSWSEGTINYSNRPTVTSTVLGELPAGSTDDTELNISLSAAGLQAGLGTNVTLALTSEGGVTDTMFLWSKEFEVEDYWPQLTLVFTPVA